VSLLYIVVVVAAPSGVTLAILLLRYGQGLKSGSVIAYFRSDQIKSGPRWAFEVSWWSFWLSFSTGMAIKLLGIFHAVL